MLFGLLKPLHCNKNSSPRTFENYWQFFPIIYILFFLLQTARDMLPLTYFKKSEKISVLDPCNSCESMKNDFPNSNTGTGKGSRKFKCCLVGNEKTNSLCRERQEKNCKIYGSLWSYSGYLKLQPKFPNITKRTVRPWVKSHKKSIQEQKKNGETNVQSTIGRVRG